MGTFGQTAGAHFVQPVGRRLFLLDLELCNQRLFGRLCGGALQYAIAAGISLWCGLGWSRGFIAALGVYADRLGRCRSRFLTVAADRYGVARAWGLGSGQFRFYSLYSVYLQPVYAVVAGRDGGSRSQSVIARSGAGLSPAHALYGLRRFFRGLCVCYCGLAGWTPGCHLGPLVTSLDTGCLDLSDDWHCAGFSLGLLRTGLGWLVVLGPGRKCVVHALVGWYRVDSLVGRIRKARQF